MTNTKNRMGALLLALAGCLALLAGCGQGAADAPQLSDEALETLASLEKVDDNFYRIDYTVDYALDALLAQGAEDAWELGDFVSRQVLQGLPFHQQAPNLACSSFTAATPDGDYIQGRNLDIADAQNVLVHTRPQDGYESLSVASGLLLGYGTYVPDSTIGRLLMLAAPYYPVDGINEKGLSAAILMLSESTPTNQYTGKTHITTTMAIRMLLDKAATVEEAIALMGQYDMHSINGVNIHFQIADAGGDSAVIEYVEDEMRVLRSGKNSQVVTNFYLSDDVVEAYRDGEDRLELLQAALDENGGIVTADRAMQMLESVKAVHDYDEATGIDYNTSYSIVFNNTRRSMDVCVNMNYQTAHHFQLGDA